jgi:hypothetical protein
MNVVMLSVVRPKHSSLSIVRSASDDEEKIYCADICGLFYKFITIVNDDDRKRLWQVTMVSDNSK